ncbi:hypothetical protein SAMN05518849_1327 [Sphingobium sp. AP50]|nr:hypothetical protein SAMN05518849_1327 [Sphingobium sp. AP50]
MSFMELRQNQLRRREAATEIFTSLETFEKDLGRTLASVSLLIGQLPVARAKANMSVVVGQEVIDRFVAALGHINQAMGAAVEGHNHLEQTRRALRLPEMGGGDKDIIPNVAQAADQVSDDHGRMTG